MNVKDITLTILILLTFLFLFITPILGVGIQNIQNNWVQYRCNPLVIPFAGLFGEDPTTTFTYCVQTMIKDFISFLLVPINQALNVIGSLGGVFTTAANDIRKMISTIRDFIEQIIQTVFGVFLNILIEIQKLVIRINDTIKKIIGILTTLLFVVVK